MFASASLQTGWRMACRGSHLRRRKQQPMQHRRRTRRRSRGNPVCARLERSFKHSNRGSADGRPPMRSPVRGNASPPPAEKRTRPSGGRGAAIGCNENAFFACSSAVKSQQCGRVSIPRSRICAPILSQSCRFERLRRLRSGARRQRRAILLAALSQNNCVPQYRRGGRGTPPPQGGGLFASLFGPAQGAILAAVQRRRGLSGRQRAHQDGGACAPATASSIHLVRHQF